MYLLDGNSLTLEQLEEIADARLAVGLSPAAVSAVDRSRLVVDRQAKGDTAVYGVNTGFGALAETAIARESHMPRS